MNNDESTVAERLWDVLLAEDDRVLNMVLCMQLQAHSKMRVRKTMNGKEAIAMMRERAPDLLVLDVSMPELNAFEIISLLRQDAELSRMPCIIHTSFDLTNAEKADLTLGETRYITKTTSEELVNVAIELLSNSVNNKL